MSKIFVYSEDERTMRKLRVLVGEINKEFLNNPNTFIIGRRKRRLKNGSNKPCQASKNRFKTPPNRFKRGN